MTYSEAVTKLSANTTKSGNYKKQAVLNLIVRLTTSRSCPNCDGKGETHSPCAFGGSDDYHNCKVCDGIGRI